MSDLNYNRGRYGHFFEIVIRDETMRKTDTFKFNTSDKVLSRRIMAIILDKYFGIKANLQDKEGWFEK